MRTNNVIRILALLLLLAIAWLSLSPSDRYSLRTETYTVASGDTMWQIAAHYMPKQDKIRDIRELCWEIKQYNHLKDYRVYANENITIPLWVRERDN